LLEVIMRRHETHSTMMTSNRPLADWGKLIGDVPAATAILARFLHHAEIITIKGRSHRLKDRAAGEATRDREAAEETTHKVCPPAAGGKRSNSEREDPPTRGAAASAAKTPCRKKGR
jgi:hypothetical protein